MSEREPVTWERGTSPSVPVTGAPVAMIDLDTSTKNVELISTHGLPPVWRRLWSQLCSAGIRVTLPRFGPGDEDRLLAELREAGVRTLILHVDNYIPPFLQRLLDRMPTEAAAVAAVACGHLPSMRPAEMLAAGPSFFGVLRGPLEDVLPAIGRVLASEQELCEVPNFVPRGVEPEAFAKSLSQVGDLTAGWSHSSSEELAQASFQGGVGILQGSSGCPCRCSFCRQSVFYRDYSRKPYRLRPIDDLLAEIAYLYESCAIRHFKIFDLNFLGTRKLAPRRAKELAAGLRELGLALTFELHCRSDSVTEEVLDHLQPVGLRHLAVGLESMSPTQLARYEKGETVEDHRRAARLVAERGLMAQGYSILADPLVSRDELRESLAGLAELNGSLLVLIHEQMVLYKGTPYFAHYGERLRAKAFVPSSLETAVRYEFNDPWVERAYPLFAAASQRFKRALSEFQQKRLPKLSAPQLWRFVMAGTAIRLDLLRRVADRQAPSRKSVEDDIADVVARIPAAARGIITTAEEGAAA